MKRLLAILLLIPALAFGTVGTYTDFYITNGGSFVNSGSTTGNNATYTSTNGNWSTTTSIFTPTDGTTPASSVNVGDYASVYIDGATVAVMIGRVSVVAAGVNGAITIGSQRCGTAPTTSATARSIKVGGAQKIPTTGGLGPLFSLSNIGSMAAAAGDILRINLKNDAQYNVTTGVNSSNVSSVQYQGYTTNPGDGGVAVIDGGTSGSAYTLWGLGTSNHITDITFQHNGATSTASGVTIGQSSTIRRCVFHDMRGSGVAVTGSSGNTFIDCEAYANNAANTSGAAGFQAGNDKFIRCISHDNSGSNSNGFTGGGGSSFQNCISDTNGADGIRLNLNTTVVTTVLNCDIYNNGGKGIEQVNAATYGYVLIENCNIIKNASTGIDGLGATGIAVQGAIDNNGYGSGSQANGGSGNTNALSYIVVNQGTNAATTTYASGATPWQDGANGDFRISNTQANWAGFGFFYQTQGGYSGTIGYPDIGAAQSKTGPGGTFSKETSAGYAH